MKNYEIAICELMKGWRRDGGAIVKEKEKFFRLNEKKIGEERTNGEETIKYYAFRRIRSV